MEASRQQLQAYRGNQGPRPVLEEFIPLKHSTTESSERSTNIPDNKANWMTSVQLWSQASDGLTKPQSTITSPKDHLQDHHMGFNVSHKLGLDNKQRNGGAFLPFSKDRSNSSSCPSPTLRPLPELALASTEKDLEDKKCSEADQINGVTCLRRSESSGKCGNGGVVEPVKGASTGNGTSEGQTANNNNNNTNNTSSTTQTHRKARRCWSPDLHRRFVNALQMLGGSQGTLKPTQTSI